MRQSAEGEAAGVTSDELGSADPPAESRDAVAALGTAADVAAASPVGQYARATAKATASTIASFALLAGKPAIASIARWP